MVPAMNSKSNGVARRIASFTPVEATITTSRPELSFGSTANSNPPPACHENKLEVSSFLRAHRPALGADMILIHRPCLIRRWAENQRSGLTQFPAAPVAFQFRHAHPTERRGAYISQKHNGRRYCHGNDRNSDKNYPI